MDIKCNLHGKTKALFAKAAKGKVCVDCVRAGLWNEEITQEIKRVYPEFFACCDGMKPKPSDE